MTTTAEGVETRDQLAYLRSEGCMEVQGYYFAKAMHNDKFREMLRRQTANAVDIYGERVG